MKLKDYLPLLLGWLHRVQYPRCVILTCFVLLLYSQGMKISYVEFWLLNGQMQGHENATAENGPWIITLDAPSFIAVMQHARNRSLREEIYRAYVTRASSGDLDNTGIIDQILKLRLEKAKLLNYNNYAEV